MAHHRGFVDEVAKGNWMIVEKVAAVEERLGFVGEDVADLGASD